MDAASSFSSCSRQRASPRAARAFISPDSLARMSEAAGVDPAFRILDDAVNARLLEEAMTEALEAAYARGGEDLLALQGNALDLSRFPDESFDLTLVLGPLYHLYTKEDKLQALSEAARVTKPGGILMVAYCMNEPTVIQYVFGLNKLREVMEGLMLTEDWHAISRPEDLFEMVRPEEIAALDAALPVERLKLVATDGPTNYLRPMVDAMDDETFEQWMSFHLTICERQDLIGASHHTLDILRKK